MFVSLEENMEENNLLDQRPEGMIWDPQEPRQFPKLFAETEKNILSEINKTKFIATKQEEVDDILETDYHQLKRNHF